MVFEARLQQTLDTLTARLQDEVARQVRLVGDVLAATAREDRRVLEEHPAQDVAKLAQLAESVRAIGSARSLTEILGALASSAAQEAGSVGVLLVHGDRLRAWCFLGSDPSFDNAEEVDRLPPGRDSVDIPIVIGGRQVAVLHAEDCADPLHLRILTAYASRCLEAMTAIKASRSLTAQAGQPVPSPVSDDASADEHAAARRYARLLVSEIELYYKPQVVAGRRERDLATRLGEEIARVRALYGQRASPAVKQTTDYVREELIRTLAEGDASLLEANV